MTDFQLISDFQPVGDQPDAIDALVCGIQKEKRFQTLLGITGSGKTFTMAHVINRLKRPSLIISHNKTLAAQLYSEFKSFFPHNAVEYFVSYYDYYQPEAYIPHTDTYIQKDASINEEIERLRLSATMSLMTRRDTIVVASVSCIYGLGSPEDYKEMVVRLAIGDHTGRDQLLRDLVQLQYERNDLAFERGSFRVRGAAVEVYPAHAEAAIRIVLQDEVIIAIEEFHPLTADHIQTLDVYLIHPAKHFVLPMERIQATTNTILHELDQQLSILRKANKIVEAQRLESRTRYDLEMLREISYCQGIENYSMHLSGRKPGEKPYTLLDFFLQDFVTFIDESHVTIPQIRGMYQGDRSRKRTLVDHGFRLPSALENRPLNFDEFLQSVGPLIFVSATPDRYEISLSGSVVEQVIRPTGILDPEIVVRPIHGQIDNLLHEIHQCVERKQRVLVTTLTKKMSEQLSLYLQDAGIKVRYLHSEIDAIERVEILRDLCKGDFDVLVGINLLREGLDLPEVALVAILDADKEGFLRSQTALIQTAGRAARHPHGRVILYADTMTEAIKKTVHMTRQRREKQEAYNREHNIIPQQTKKSLQQSLSLKQKAQQLNDDIIEQAGVDHDTAQLLYELEQEMLEAAEQLNFEHAAYLRDKIDSIKKQLRKKKIRTNKKPWKIL